SYGISWDTSTVSGGSHTLTALARDTSGNTAPSAAISVTLVNANDPSVVGQWSSVMNWPLVAVNTVLLKNGKVLMWDGGPACIGSESVRICDPATKRSPDVPIHATQ